MQTSKSNIRRILSLVFIVTYTVAILFLLGDLMEPVSYGMYYNHDIEVIEKDNECDMVFVGASRTYRSFVPQVFENEMGLHGVVNAGSSSQQIFGSYHLLKDLIERLHPKRVFICVTFDELLETKSESVQAKLLVLDRLSLLNRIHMLIDCFEGNERLYALKAYRFRNNFSPNILKNIQEKKKILENNYKSYGELDEYYADTGFVYSTKSCETGNIPIKGYDTFSRGDLLDSKLGYLDKCIQLCVDNGIKVELLTGPTTMMRVYNVKGYQDAVDFYKEYAALKGINYYNLNYLKGREEFLPDELMYDYNHLNGAGAYVVSKRFASILNLADNGEDVSKFFYNDLSELKADTYRIVAVEGSFRYEDNGMAHVTVNSLQNEEMPPSYRIEYVSDDDENEVVVDWTQETEFDIPLTKERNFKVLIRASARKEGIKEAYQLY